MAQPNAKSPGIESFLDNLLGVSRRGEILADKCVGCRESAGEFRDDLSRREYSISGLCQSCQDKIFN